MTILPSFSLAHLTVLDLRPPDVVRLAAKLGYRSVGLRLLPTTPGSIAYPLADDPALLRETLACIAETGVAIHDVEIVRLDPGFDARKFFPLLDVAATLEAKSILVAGTDPDEQRMTESYASLCEAALPYGFFVDLEFMPWTHVPDVSSALRIVGSAGQPNGGILVDTLHVSRSRSSLKSLAAIPPALIHYVQVSDAPTEIPPTMEAVIQEARAERLLPGEGDLDIGAILSVLPPALPVSIETPNVGRASRVGHDEWARQALAATQDLLSGIVTAT